MDDHDARKQPTISVVIPTLNEENDLQECLNSIHSSDYPKEKIEIIVSDTGSTDQTINIAKKNNVKVLELRPERPSAAFGLYHGLQRATGDYIQYLAADSLLEKNWLRRAVEEFHTQKQDENVGVVGGITKEWNPKDSFFSFILSIGLRASETVKGNVLYNAGSGLIKREIIQKTKGGFNFSLVSEDEVDFGIKVREAGFLYRKISYIMIFHKLGLKNNLSSLKKMLKRYWRQGVGLGQIHAIHENSKFFHDYFYSMRMYKIASLFPFLILLIIAISLYNLLLALTLFLSGLVAFLFLLFPLAKKFQLNYLLTFSLSAWYLCTIWIIFAGYAYFMIFRPKKYEPSLS